MDMAPLLTFDGYHYHTVAAPQDVAGRAEGETPAGHALGSLAARGVRSAPAAQRRSEAWRTCMQAGCGMLCLAGVIVIVTLGIEFVRRSTRTQ